MVGNIINVAITIMASSIPYVDAILLWESLPHTYRSPDKAHATLYIITYPDIYLLDGKMNIAK